MSTRLMVLGLGNEILSDEGFGVHVVRALKDVPLPEGVVLLEGGVGGFNLLGSIDGVDHLLVVDVMLLEAPPGELHFIPDGSQVREPGKQLLSFHHVGILELRDMWRLLGHEPRISFLVTPPEVLEWGTELSAPLERARDAAVRLIPEFCAKLIQTDLIDQGGNPRCIPQVSPSF